MSDTPTLQQIPHGIATLADHEALARQHLDDNAWAYFSGGAGDEITLRANRSAWDALPLWPRVLQPLSGGHTRVDLLGRTLAHPILLAPVAFQRLAHPDGELAMAYAAAALGAGIVLSTQASVSLEAVAEAVKPDPGRGPLWFQLYLQHDRGFTQTLAQRAESAGYEALVLTVDAPTSGVRDRERRAGFRLPPGIGPVNLVGLPTPPSPHLQPGQSALFDGLLRHAPTWDDIAWLQSITRLPVLLKGVLHPADARHAVSLGVAGLIISNHGGRTLDTSPSTASVLPRVADAVAGAVPVLVDGGIRRGTDVLKAMALGASAVLVGRPVVWGLANAGAAGVAHVLRLLRDELEIAMALTGCATLADASPALLDLDAGQDKRS
ncbi:MAG: alpha-hydroxy-acid oxidizing protein [Gammaproteobacteria bacterium]|nr:alpha-hydroxy-acid oxidizing protein [Gammaproteobacteria bacterium]MBU1505651.1 alpha-hydroxy-acid oxidizing protein [Gammaproteobacteria bacterium]MBU2123100.1 alpha-hydroxy-acid oxidizing protein [Gammaproteobacteria bacterium]MBU2170883.1 alpha-hydroxy-acid oxidizing protein [Gammaproteobacteria bacterium]MBU2200898.1 alpha-hydroxy-acid oxidizing protein [Gammaproteobacteria bacterium]